MPKIQVHLRIRIHAVTGDIAVMNLSSYMRWTVWKSDGAYDCEVSDLTVCTDEWVEFPILDQIHQFQPKSVT